jgi:hypothetical protein
MAVVSVATMTLKPGTYAAFTELHKRAKSTLEFCGAKNVRLLGTLLAGEATGSIVLTWEADDYASYGTVMDKFLNDSAGRALVMEIGSPENPVAAFQSSLWADIPT